MVEEACISATPELTSPCRFFWMMADLTSFSLPAVARLLIMRAVLTASVLVAVSITAALTASVRSVASLCAFSRASLTSSALLVALMARSESLHSLAALRYSSPTQTYQQRVARWSSDAVNNCEYHQASDLP